jgi:hypothetical protein
MIVFEPGERKTDGTLRFCRVVAKSHWQTYGFALSKKLIESDSLKTILNKIEQNGGQWERVLGGLLFVHLPPDSKYDPSPDIETLARR